MPRSDLKPRWTFLGRLQGGLLDFDLRVRSVPVAGIVVRLSLLAALVVAAYEALGRIAG